MNKYTYHECDRPGCGGREFVEVERKNHPGESWIGQMCTKCGAIEKSEGGDN